jgi:hypothetical protein
VFEKFDIDICPSAEEGGFHGQFDVAEQGAEPRPSAKDPFSDL